MQKDCVVDLSVCVLIFAVVTIYTLALLDLYSQASLSLLNPTPSRLRVRNMEVGPSYSYYACRSHVGLCVQCPSQ